MTQSHFTLFNLPHQFPIDQASLTRQYFALQSKHHPDKAKDNLQKQEFLAFSITINQAYQTLQDDFKRACYLLQLAGIDILSEDQPIILPLEILEQIWQHRTQIEATNAPDQLQSLLKHANAYKNNLLHLLTESFNCNDLQKASMIAVELKYATNLINTIKSKLEVGNAEFS